jgi:hypothetical protein
MESIGFGGLLQIPNVALRKQMILDIVQAYDTREHGLMILGQLVRVTLDDVHHIMGLETGGNDVIEHIKRTPNSENETVDNELFKRFACSDNHKLELAGLEDMLRKDLPPNEDFLRAFILFTIGVIIAKSARSPSPTPSPPQQPPVPLCNKEWGASISTTERLNRLVWEGVLPE